VDESREESGRNTSLVIEYLVCARGGATFSPARTDPVRRQRRIAHSTGGE
jgi:hypothetical protein